MSKMKMTLKKVKLNKANVRRLLRSQETLNLVKDHAYRTQSGLGEGYGVSYRIGKNRARASVSADSIEARRENAENNTILKALK